MHRFVCDWAHCCTLRSLNHFFEMFIILTTMTCTVYAFTLIPTEELEREGRVATAFLTVMSVATLVLVAVTAYTVYHRWRKANSEVDIVQSPV